MPAGPPHADAERHDRRRDAASSPSVAVRSGSPAVLSRTFQARCRTADTATRPTMNGVTPGTLPADVAPREAERAERHAADDQHGRGDQPGRVEDAGHRLAEVLVDRQLEDRVGQLERSARVCRAGTWRSPGSRSPTAASDERTSPPTASPTPANAAGGQPQDADPGHRRDDVAALRHDPEPDEHRHDHGHQPDGGQRTERARGSPSSHATRASSARPRAGGGPRRSPSPPGTWRPPA